MLSDARLAYQRRETELGAPAMRELERRVVLSVIDRRWRDHLYEMDYLKDGIGLRAMAQRDPLVEYQREGFALYQNMMGAIREESVGFLFNLEVEVTGGDGTARSRRRASARPATRRQGSATRRRARTRPARSRCATSAASSSRRRRSAPSSRAAAARRARSTAAAGQGGQRRGRSAGRPAAGRPAAGRRARRLRSATDGQRAPPQNRAQRRAQEKRR